MRKLSGFNIELTQVCSLYYFLDVRLFKFVDVAEAY